MDTVYSEEMLKEEFVSFSVEIQVTNFEKSLSFYSETLHFEVIRIERESKFASLRFNNAIFMIREIEQLPNPKGVGILLRFLFPGDLKAFYDELVEKKMKILKPYKKMPYGLTRFYVADPDGYQVKFAKEE